MDMINLKSILKHSKTSTSLQKVTQQGLRGIVLLLLFFSVSCSDSTSSGGDGGAGNSDIIGGNPVASAEFGHTEPVEYGQINLREGITNANYAFRNFTSNGLSVDNIQSISILDGKITIRPGLRVGVYTFQVEVTDANDPGKSYVTSVQRFSVGRRTITIGDFSISATSVSKSVGYTDTGYGTITPTSGLMVTYAISGNPSEITMATNNQIATIAVAPGLGENTYTFQVEATGIDDYEGIATIDLELVIEPAAP